MKVYLNKILCDPITGKSLRILNFDIKNEKRDVSLGILYPEREKYYYPIIDGIPRMLVGYKDKIFDKTYKTFIKNAINRGLVKKMKNSEQNNIDIFSIHWKKIHSFDNDDFSVWGIPGSQIRKDLFRIYNIKKDNWFGKWILDAGSGSGVASIQLAKSGAEVIAMDITEGVDKAQNYCRKNKIDTNKLHFIQASIEHPCIKKNVLDAIYSNGVLHHTPSTKESFLKLSELLKKGGLFYVWLYIKPVDMYSTVVYSINSLIRKILRPFGPNASYKFSKVWVYFMWSYHRIRKVFGIGDPYYLKLSIKNHLLEIYDHFSVAYDWHHTYNEVFEWFDEAGYYYKSILGISTTLDYKKHGVSVIGFKE